MTLHDVRFPGESSEYREQRNKLLEAEMALRSQIEAVARLRRTLPPGGPAKDYTFADSGGEVSLTALFGEHKSLILYSFMYGPEDSSPCPMCSAFIDSLKGQARHIQQRAGLAVVARSPYAKVAALAEERQWQNLHWLSAADNTYAQDYHTEMPNGAQVPMCNVFVRTDDGVRHFWNSELFFAPGEGHPRHVDNLWSLWSFFDLTPEGRTDFMPKLNYNE